MASLGGISSTAIGMCGAGFGVFVIGSIAAKRDLSRARGLETLLVLTNVCFAVPLAVFGALHLFGPQFVASIVPRYMPVRMFWVYFVGCALLAASVSVAARVAVRWSGLLVGMMMFLFVAMIHLPGALAQPHDRILWTIVFRETSFGGAGLLLAGYPTVGRICVTVAMAVFGVEHFLHPTGLPGVPLRRQMPGWVPGRDLVDYMTGAALLVGAATVLLGKSTRTVVAWVAAWLLSLVVLIYGPVLIGIVSETAAAAQVERINYFADTLLFTAAVLALARSADARH